MTKKEIIQAIKTLAWDPAFSSSERHEALLDIEIAAQDERDKLEERFSPK